VGIPSRRRRGKLRCAELRAGREHLRATLDVAAGEPHVGADRTCRHLECVLRLDNALDRNDRIGSGRNDRPVAIPTA